MAANLSREEEARNAVVVQEVQGGEDEGRVKILACFRDGCDSGEEKKIHDVTRERERTREAAVWGRSGLRGKEGEQKR